MKALMISPPSHFNVPVFNPLGIAYVSSYLKQNDIDSSCYDMFDKSFDDVRKLIEKENPDVVGISCFTNLRMEAVRVAEIVKGINPDCKVVFGGTHASCMSEQILKNYPIDFIIHSEGEYTMLNLINNIDSPVRVKGISFIKNNNVIKTESQPFIDDLDSLPFPDVDNLTRNKYQTPSYKKDGETIKINTKSFSVITSRGCPFDCKFCSTPRFWGREWRARSPKNIYAEIKSLHNIGIEHIMFTDDSFTINQKRTIKICRLIRDFDITFSCETRVNCISKELLSEMKKSGCLFIQYGLESCSETILKAISKMITVKEIIKAFKLTKEAGISTEAFLMVGNPSENEKTIQETINILKIIKPDNIYCALALIYPNTSLYDLAKEKGIINDSYWLEDKDPPVYTGENSLRKLRYYQYRIISEYIKDRSYFEFLKFVSSKALSFWKLFGRKRK